MLRRQSWFMPLRTSSSVRGAPSPSKSGTWKTYCGWPAAKPPSAACGRQPSSCRRETTPPPAGAGGRRAELVQLGDDAGADVVALGGWQVGEPAHRLLGDALLHLGGAP